MPPSSKPAKPTTTTADSRPASPVGFLPLDPMSELAGSSPSPTTAPTTRPGRPATEADAGASRFESGSPAPTPATPSTTTRSFSPASFDTAGWRKLFREAVATVGALANDRLVRSPEARDAGVWLADENDKADIGDPAGAIAGRHLGLLNLKNVDDLEDLVKLITAAGAYVMANVNRLVELGRAKRASRLAQHARPDTEGDAA